MGILVIDGERQYVTALCVCCSTQISFHPDHVPSLRVDGERRPLCRACFDEWNQLHRTSKGLEPVPLHPLAYVEVDDAS